MYFRNLLPLQAVPEQLKGALIECRNATQAPFEIAFVSQLTTAAVACQGLIDVQRKVGLVGPVNIYAIAIAERSNRKTASERKFGDTLREFDRNQAHTHLVDVANHKADLVGWKAKVNAISRQISQSERNGEDATDHVNNLKSLYQRKPPEPSLKRVLMRDTSPEALKFELKEIGASIGGFSDEAGNLLNGRTISDFAFYNSLWDASTIQVDRRSSECFVIDDARLSLSLLVQPGIFHKFMEKKGKDARESGMLSRFFICAPLSNEGYRPTDASTPDSHCLKAFNERVLELLQFHRNSLASGNFKRQLLKFAPDAQTQWIDIFNFHESQITPYGQFYGIKDYVSKYADNLARVAAIFHFFQGKEGDISLETLNQASVICEWFLLEFQRLFSPPPPVATIPQPVIDAELLKESLIKYFNNSGLFWIDKSYLLRHAHGSIRDNDRLMPAILALMDQNLILPIQPTYIKGRKPKIQYELNREFFLNVARQRGYSPD